MSGVYCVQTVTSENTRRCAHTLACPTWWQRAIKTRDVTRRADWGNLISMDYLCNPTDLHGGDGFRRQKYGDAAFTLVTHLSPPGY